MKDYKKWLEQADTDDLVAALRRFAELNQTKVYLFLEKINESGIVARASYKMK